MATRLGLSEHVDGLRRSGLALREAAAKAGLDAPVPTCPAWDVAKLVTHQGMVHRWAAANLRGDSDHDTSASVAEAKQSADLLGWFTAGLDALIDTVMATPEDAKAAVFLNDAPPPRRFWARRQAHETSIHSVDAIAAALGRQPTSSDVDIDPTFAADGIDELLTGFITRGKGKLHAEEPYELLVRATDTGDAWSVRISNGPIVTTRDDATPAAATFSGTAVQLYLTLWNRADEVDADAPPNLLADWRSAIRIRWN
ncbi:MAG TPA: maleylpyruvate isomerase family mycothiol-dependent enzyme [Micromonosporaceae bacterium]|nr:maleylpyruvate isomerase family mycothiol-dependent enzyme [Micromonosporaceae bacterium]